MYMITGVTSGKETPLRSYQLQFAAPRVGGHAFAVECEKNPLASLEMVLRFPWGHSRSAKGLRLHLIGGVGARVEAVRVIYIDEKLVFKVIAVLQRLERLSRSSCLSSARGSSLACYFQLSFSPPLASLTRSTHSLCFWTREVALQGCRRQMHLSMTNLPYPLPTRNRLLEHQSKAKPTKSRLRSQARQPPSPHCIL